MTNVKVTHVKIINVEAKNNYQSTLFLFFSLIYFLARLYRDNVIYGEVIGREYAFARHVR